MQLLNESQINFELNESKNVLQQRGYKVNHFAYPHGGWSNLSNNLTKLYYNSARITNDSLEVLPENADKYLLRSRSTNDQLKSITDYQSYIDEAITNKGWLIWTNHAVLPGNCSLCVDPLTLGTIIDYAVNNRVKIVNMGEAISGSWKK